MKRGRGRPPKSTKVEKSTKAPPKKHGKAVLQGSSQLENDHILLWMCFEESEAIKYGQTTIDYNALGKRLGLPYGQAKARYYALRSRVQKLMSTVISEATVESEQANELAAEKKEEIANEEQKEDGEPKMEDDDEYDEI